MDVHSKPLANPLVVLREEFDDWAVLFNPDTADAVGLNPVGVTLWKAMDGTRTLAHLLTTVQTVYAEVPHTANDEIGAFIDDLAERGFIGYANGTTV